jgi:cardiolipin synthase
MNIGREYRYDWHDMMVELKGPVVAELVRESDRAAARDRLGDLSFFTRPGKNHRMFRAESEPGANLRLLRTLPHDSQIYRAQLAAARTASSRIYIENAYFSDDRMLYALIRARLRGVDVRVIIPSRGDSGPMDRSNAVTVNILTRFGVRVFIYPGMSHVKAALFDGWACFGSANFDRLSLRLNRELNIGTSDPQIVADLEGKIFEVDFARSTELRARRPVQPADRIYEWLADLML